jgi:lysophospholipase L1-like esterase
MNHARQIRCLSISGLMALLLVTAAGCSGGAGGSSAGAGGRGGSAGSGGSGGSSTTGTGGTTTTGGTTGTGGTSAGGTTGTGGTTTTGGTTGAGGTSTTGGTTGTSSSGGRTGTGGATGTGGGAGGVTGSGGTTGRGGTQGSGGTTGTGGGAGGVTGTGGGSGGTGGGTGGAAGDGGVRPDGGNPDGTPDGGDAGSVWNPCPTTAGTACKVLPLGDSITEGCCVSPMGGYRIELFRQAVKDNKNITFVGALVNGPTTVENKTFPRNHEGHGGYTIDSGTGHNGISGQITQNALSSYSPHIVLLMIGTNDINGNIDQAGAPTRLANLMDDILTRAPAALLVVASIIPSKTDGTNTNFQKYNAAIPGLVDTRAKAGKHIVFVDNYKVFSANASYKTAWMYDNLHPNDAGYVALGQSFYGVIGAFLPAAP